MSSLTLNRLIVMKGGKRAYDQAFHEGLNIIHGSNGSGKSTIADFIFFSLGGELKEWKEHALLCDEVLAEVEASETRLTLKREIAGEGRRPMRIFFGGLDAALESATDGWSLFPYSRSERSKSFSQALFSALEIPEVPGDEGANITIHQLLRLMYNDQLTPFQKIFRAEDFDARITREAVAELLCGIGSRELFSKQIQLRELKSRETDVRNKLASLLQATASLREDLSAEAIQSQFNDAIRKRSRLHQELRFLQEDQRYSVDAVKETERERQKVLKDLSRLREEQSKLENEQTALHYEIADSEKFIEHLRNLLEEFEHASTTYLSLGGVKFTYCPACFTPLRSPEEGNCNLCGSSLPEEDVAAKTLAVKLDIEGQLRESTALQSKRRQEFEELKTKISRLKRNITRTSGSLEEIQAAAFDGRAAQVIQLSREIGKLDARTEELDRLAELSHQINALSKDKERLSGEISSLEDTIKSLEAAKQQRRREVLTKISENTKDLLRKDMPEHNDFEHLDKFDFSFEDDWYAVNGEPNITTSASGMVVTKNSLLLGIFITSLQDSQMFFPKFLLLDNVEDKGMVGDRVRHFQGVIAETLKEEQKDYPSARQQIIITTSTLNEELDTDDYVVGPRYTRERRTLNLDGGS